MTTDANGRSHGDASSIDGGVHQAWPLRTVDGIELTEPPRHTAPWAILARDPDDGPRRADPLVHQLIWPLHGATAHVSAGGQSLLLVPPDALWVQAGASIEVRGAASVGVARFRADTCPTAWGRTVHVMLQPGVTALLDWLPEQAGRPWASAVLDAVVEQIAGAHARVAVSLPLPSEPALRAMALALLDDPSDRRGLEALAHEIGWSERTFRRRFAAETGVPFTTWRSDLRIQTAMSMLDAGRSVESTAERCGYSSRSGFTRAFKAATGLAPSSYRRVTPSDRPDMDLDWPRLRGAGPETGEVSLRSSDKSAFSSRATALAAAGMLLLAACGESGSDDEASESASSPASTVDDSQESEQQESEEQDTTEPEPGDADAETDEPEPEAAAEEAQDVDEGAPVEDNPCDEGSRWFDREDLAGEPTCIPEDPQRILAIGFAPAELMLVTGTDFVGGASAYSFFLEATHPEWVPALTTTTDGLDDLFGFEIYIETLALAAPDLIVMTAGFTDPATAELVREIAPTVEFDLAATGADWRAEFRFAGDAMGLSDQVEALIADADSRLEELAAAVGDSLAGQTVSVARARPNDGLQLRLGGSSAGLILTAAGIERPPSQAIFANSDGFFTQELSQELWIEEADADHIFLYANQPTGANEELLASIQDNPLWQQMAAVRSGQAYAVGAHWHSAGVLAEHKVIDDLFELLLGTESPTSGLAPQPPAG